jgi:hypothetical protein
MIVLLGALFVPATGILLAMLVAGRRTAGEQDADRDRGGGNGRSVPGARTDRPTLVTRGLAPVRAVVSGEV